MEKLGQNPGQSVDKPRLLKKAEIQGAMRIAPRRVLAYASKQPQEQRCRLAFFNSLNRGRTPVF
jgi:hypothetical protein